MRSLRALLCAVVAASCDTGRPEPSDTTAAISRPAAPETARRAAPLGVHRPEELVTAATDLLGFLRGIVPFARIRLADTVTLQMSREGLGAPRRVARERLRDPSNWTIRGPRPQSGRQGIGYSFVPDQDQTVLTTRVGRHLKCMEYDLSSVAPELAALPHVGTMLKPTDYGSCLQTWNVTFVFDSAAKPPVLVAAVYDQWEW